MTDPPAQDQEKGVPESMPKGLACEPYHPGCVVRGYNTDIIDYVPTHLTQYIRSDLHDAAQKRIADLEGALRAAVDAVGNGDGDDAVIHGLCTALGIECECWDCDVDQEAASAALEPGEK